MSNQQDLKYSHLFSNEQEEKQAVYSILNYAQKTIFTLDPWFEAKKIDPKILDENLKKNQTGSFFSNAYSFASTLIDLQIEETESFCEMHYRDKHQKIWRELYLLNDATGEFELNIREQITETL